MTNTVISEAQKLSQDALVKLYSLDLTELGGPVLLFTDSKNGSVFFGGLEYVPVDVEMANLEINSESSGSSPTVKITHNGSPISGYLETYGDLTGAMFSRMRTYVQFLDTQSGGTTPNSSQVFGPDSFYIERLSHLDEISCEFELAASLNVDGIMWPYLLILKDICNLDYRTYSGGTFTQGRCPYNGSSYFTDLDVATNDPSKDQCSNKRAGCKKRYPTGPLPMRACLGVRRSR